MAWGGLLAMAILAVAVLSASVASAQMVEGEPISVGDGGCEPCLIDGNDECGVCPEACRPTISDRLWVRGEYLMWWTKGVPLPPLVTTSPSDTPDTEAGILGQPGTQILFGDSRVADDIRGGARVTLGWWLNPCRTVGVEASYMQLRNEIDYFRATDGDHAILARPFFNLSLNQQDASLVTYPGVRSGAVEVENSTGLETGEILLRLNRGNNCVDRTDLLLGYRYASLRDGLGIRQVTRWVDGEPPIVAGSTLDLADQFNSSNVFQGGQIGLSGRKHFGRMSLDVLVKLGLGTTRSAVTIAGETTTTVPGGEPFTTPGGLLAPASKLGHFEQNEFSFIPEVGVTLGYDFTTRARASIGYNFLYWTNVSRAGQQVDFAVDPTLPESDSSTQLAFTRTGFWAQGLTFGFEYDF